MNPSTVTRGAATAGLLGAAALHARWAAQTRNGSLPDDFAEVWIGEGARTPPAWMSAGVGAVLAAMATAVNVGGRPARGVSVILGARAVGGMIDSLVVHRAPTRYRRRDLMAYSPVCAALSGLAWHAARGGYRSRP